MKNQDLKHKVSKDYLAYMLNYVDAISKDLAHRHEVMLQEWSKLEFERFSNGANHYRGPLKNMIFIYYHDHYRGNGSTHCSAEFLIDPNEDLDDRGYIKGIALDLSNYLRLRDLHSRLVTEIKQGGIFHNGFKIRKSKNYDAIMVEKTTIDQFIHEKIASLKADYKIKQDAYLNQLTGLSIAYYNINF